MASIQKWTYSIYKCKIYFYFFFNYENCMWFYGQTLKRSLHALLGGFRVVSEECVHRHHHAGGTEATLNAMVLHHVLLQQI